MNLDGYTITATVGVGCIGTVYRAIDGATGRVVALKVLRRDSPVVRARHYFLNEARLLARLDHPGIPAFHALIGGRQPVIVCELIAGQDLEAVLAARAGFLPECAIIGWAVQVCDVLTYLHTHRVHPVVFRDLKASHIMVDAPGRAWVVDFNLARPLPLDGQLTGADLVGTEGFAAPEQYDGTALPASDIYGLGATLHYLLTRIDPRQPPPFTFAPPRTANPAISPGLAAVIMRALAHDPADRFPDAAAFRGALRACR